MKLLALLDVSLEGTEPSHLAYEIGWLVAFVVVAVHAARTKTLHRLLAALAYGTSFELVVYVLFDKVNLYGVGRLYDHGRFVLMVDAWGSLIPVYMLGFWAVFLFISDQCARRLFGTHTFWARFAVATTLALSLDIPTEPVADSHGFWRYRIDAMNAAGQRWSHWSGSPFPNLLAWYALQGGLTCGSYVADKLSAGRSVPTFVQLLAEYVLSCVFGFAWCVVMTLLRHSDFLGLSDLGVLLAAMAATLVATGILAQRAAGKQQGLFKQAPLFEAGVALAWHLGNCALMLCDCRPHYPELCTRDGAFLVIASAVASALLFSLPKLISAAQPKPKPKRA